MSHLLGPVLVELDAAYVDGPAGRHALTPLEVKLLRRLIAADGAFVDRSELLRDVWGYRPNMVTRTVDVAVARLRGKIEPEPAAPRWLRSERGAGYQLVAEGAARPAEGPPPPALDHPILGRGDAIGELLGALSRGPAQVCGVPGVGVRAVARAVAGRWAGPVAWVRVPPGEAATDALAAAMGWALDPLNVRVRLAAFEGLLVLEGDPADLPLGPRRLIVGGLPRAQTAVTTLAPLGEADGLALLRGLAPRELGSDEEEGARTLVRSCQGLPALLALHARELRFARADALVAPAPTDRPALHAAWAAARARLPADAAAALDALAALGGDVPYAAAALAISAAGVADPAHALETLVRAGWVVTGWSAAGEVRFTGVEPPRGTPSPALLPWLHALPDAALRREVALAYRVIASADPAPPELGAFVARVHVITRIRGGWGPFAHALARAPSSDARVLFARGEAAYHAGDVPEAVRLLQAALDAGTLPAVVNAEVRALCGFYLSRSGRREESREVLAAVPEDGSRADVEATFAAALLDSEDGVGGERPVERLRRALNAAERIGEPRLLARARAYLATALLHRDGRAAIPHFERAIAEAEAVDALASAALMRSVLAWALLDAGEPAPAAAVAARARDALHATGAVLAARDVERAIATTRLLAGELEDARRLLLELLRGSPTEALVRAQLAALERQAGFADEAARHAEAARELSCRFAEEEAARAAWLHAAGLGPPPPARWSSCSPEVRIAARFAAGARPGTPTATG